MASWVAQAEAGLDGPEQLAWLERFDAEIDNVRSAIDWARDRDPAMYASIVTGCATAWGLRGLLHEARAEFARLLQRDDLDPKVKARASAASARIAYRAGDLTNAAALASDALEAARALGDDSTAARALFTLGAVTTFRSPPAARELLRDGERRARAAGDEPALIDLLQMVAWTHAFQEDHGSAAEVLDEVADLVERSSAERAVLQRTLRAFRMIRQGRFVEARAMIEPAVEIAGELGDLWALAFALAMASQAASACGDNELYDVAAPPDPGRGDGFGSAPGRASGRDGAGDGRVECGPRRCSTSDPRRAPGPRVRGSRHRVHVRPHVRRDLDHARRLRRSPA